jgi:integrase
MNNDGEALANDNPQKNCVTGAHGRKRNYSKSQIQYWREVIKKQGPNYCCAFQYRGARKNLSLGTSNREAAAEKARQIYLSLTNSGWSATLAWLRPTMADKKKDVTVGQYIECVRAAAVPIVLSSPTFEVYARALRRLAADVTHIPRTAKMHDIATGGRVDWLERAGKISLAVLTKERVQTWRTAFLKDAGDSFLSQDSRKVTINSVLRSAKSLFAPAILDLVKDKLVLPEPLPFAGVKAIKQGSRKYRSEVDLELLIAQAHVELAPTEPEAFKIFLLATFAGLRRKEADLLEWQSVRFDEGVIRIERTDHFKGKTDGSCADVDVDREVMELLRGYRAKATGKFVIESDRQPHAASSYQHYRCQPSFRKLSDWLRTKGITGHQTTHILRKEYGSQLCEKFGIHSASVGLRHASIGLTSSFYVDNRKRATLGLGHLLSGDQPTKVVPMSAESAQKVS